tara:strand:- start:7577 stop:7795 length:219 start_codon:yes stop_codon:yes gene_type:complete
LGWKEKEHRKKQKAIKQEEESQKNDNSWESEMLRIQGLHRCEKCDEIYRLHDDKCEHCGALNPYYHSQTSSP